jgi:RNA polymerase sigma-70 factor (ECF subfamily)
VDLTPEQFDRIVDEYVDYVYAIVYRVLCNTEDAQDAAQETFIKLFSNFGRYNREKNLKNWICTIALNSARDIYRKRKSHMNTAVDFENLTDNKTSTEDGVINTLLTRQMLESLPFNHRVVMVMFYIEHMPVEEIARTVKRSEVLVRVWLHRGRETLVKKFGGNPA